MEHNLPPPESSELIERQREHFDRISDRYEKGRAEKNHITLKQLIWKEALSGVAERLPRPFAVLEPMCGDGEGADILTAHLNDTFSYEGFDYSEKMVEHAKRTRPEARIWQADATKFSPEENAYNVIILIGGLHHIPNSAADCVNRLARGLRPGGLFINFEPTSGNPIFSAVRKLIYRKNEIFDEETERAFSVSEWSSIFEEAELKKSKVFYPGLIAYVLYYNPYAFPLINIGGIRAVKFFFTLDKLFMHNALGRFFSFATLGVWRKPGLTDATDKCVAMESGNTK